MSLFQCNKCGCMENTALTECSYNQLEVFVDDPKEIVEYKELLGLKKNEKFGDYCSACCPIGDRKWHGEFDRIFLPMGEFKTDDDGNLIHKKTGDKDFKKYAIKIIKYGKK